MSTMQRHGLAYLRQGYLIIPERPRSKMPAIADWQNARLTASDVETYASCGIGVLCGQGEFPIVAVDIDTTNAGLASAIRDYCLANLGWAPERTGRPPKTMLVFRATHEGLKKIQSEEFICADGQRHRVEVLAHGQQFVADGIHPDTGEAYRWVDERGGMVNVPASHLTAVSEAGLREIPLVFERLAPQYGLQPKSASRLPARRSTSVQVLDPLDTYQSRVGVTLERARQLATYADNEDYESWRNVGMAFNHEFEGSPAALDVWDEWSSTASNYQGREDLEKRWRGFGRGGQQPLTMRWLLKLESSARRASESEEHATYTDAGNGRRLAMRFGEQFRYTSSGGFFVNNGPVWVRDEKNVLMHRLAKDTAFAMLDEVKAAGDQKAAFNHARRSQSKSALDNMIALARSEPGIAASLDEFDSDPMLLNVLNGTIDLRTGSLRPHRREDLITKIAAVKFDEDASCPRWVAFLHRATNGDVELVSYLQRFVGYALTGLTSEQCLLFLYGLGANGKSVFVETLLAMLGDYASVAQTELVMARKNSGIPNDVARLKGCRMACLNETSQGAYFDEARLKDLTGGDRLTARFLLQEYFDFVPTHKLIIRGNHKPRIMGTDDGIWRRLHIVPFTVRIPEHEKDKQLPAKLRAELPGILRWAVEGCIQWSERGLTPPATVTKAVEEYRQESDTLGRFLAECCELGPRGAVASSVLYGAYAAFCARNNERAIPSKSFPDELLRRTLTYKKTSGPRMILGVSLRSSTDEPMCAA